MGLHLTGKGSILDAIGGALNTGANAVVAGIKDLGDLGSLGVANLTHNQQAAQNARSAISSNDSNLSGQSFPARVVNDVYDKTALPMYQQTIGDAPSGFETGPIGTFIKEQAAERTGNVEAYQHAKTTGDAAAAAYTKRLPELAATGFTEGGGVRPVPEEIPSPVPKPEINEKPVPAPKAAPAEPTPVENTGPKVTVANQPLAANIEENPISEPPTPNPTEPTPPEPSPAEIQQATDNLNASMNEPAVDWTKVAGANQELMQTTQDVAQQMRQGDIMQNQLTGPTDLFKQIKDHGGIGASDYEDIPNHLKRKNGPSMDRLAQELGYKDDSELHDAISAEGDRRAKSPAPIKSMAEYRDQAEQYIHAHPEEFDNVPHRAVAERHYQAFQKADKGSGYDKAKWQIPKGAPARKFIQALYDKTHSPEYAARNNVGATLGDVRNTLKGVRRLRDQAQKELNLLSKRGSGASEDSIRSKAAEVRSQNTRYNYLKGLEQHHALTYKTLATGLDEKFPEINLSAKKGVRLTSNQQAFETAQPTQGANVPEVRAGKQPEDPMAAIRARAAEKPGYSGPNLNEGAFSVEDRAKLEAANKLDQFSHENQLEHSPEGDRAILEGIKNGDSDAQIIKAYQEATGTDEATAKKAYGAIEDNPNAEKVGAVENNPYHGKLANYDVELPHKGIAVRSLTYGRRLIGKAMLRAHAPADQLATKLYLFANHAWEQLGPEDRALADNLRNHSIEEVSAQAKDPEAFKAYATAAKDIEDYIHAARGNADPYDVTPYRQNYGASFHLQDEAGKPVTLSQFEGQSHAFQLGRHFSNYADLEEASGMKRSTQDFHEDLTKDVIATQHHITTNSLYFGLKQAFGDQAVALGKPTSEARVPLTEYPGVFARDDIAKRINDRARYVYGDDKIGSAFHTYDKLNSSMKNVKLSLGGFHNVNIMLNQAALNPAGIGRSTAAWANPEYFRRQMAQWDQNGTLEKALHSGLTLGGGSEFDSAVNRVPVIKQAHDALFKRQIPFSKMQVFERYTRGLDLNNPADYEQMRGVARGINNTFGGINRLVDGMNYTRLKQFGRGVLAADYNEGQIRTLLTSLDPRKIGTIEGRMARQVVVGRAVILSLPGTAQAAMTGQLPNNPKDLAKFYGEQLVNPTMSTGYKTAGGNPKRITLIAGVVNKADRAIAPMFDKNNPNKFSGIDQEAAGNLSPAASFAEEEKTNKDYYGNPIRSGNIWEDAAAAANAAAPIPASPGARALESVPGLKDNRLVKIMAGGQSAISPGEAAIDISGVGRVSADPNAPAMVILNSRQKLAETLKSESDKAALQAIHPTWDQSLSNDQIKAIYANPNYEINKWNALRQNDNVYNVLVKQDKVAQANGEPGNPLLSLPKSDYDTLTEYEFLKHADEGTDANNTAAVMYAEHKDMINKYEQDNQAYQQQMNALFVKNGGTKGDPAPIDQIGGAPKYTVTPQQTASANQYFNLTDSKARAQFLTEHPELSTLFEAQFQAENEIRRQQGEPLLKDYPQAPAGLQNWITNYIAGDKATRSSLRKASPGQFSAMQNYLASVDEYQLSKTAGQAQFVGHDLSQANLKEIYNLGQYDIAKKTGADGNDTYVVDPGGAFAAGGGSGSGSRGSRGFGRSSSASKTIARLRSNAQAREVKGTVKFAYHPAKVYIRGKKNPHFQKVHIASAKRPKVNIKAKSVPVV